MNPAKKIASVLFILTFLVFWFGSSTIVHRHDYALGEVTHTCPFGVGEHTHTEDTVCPICQLEFIAAFAAVFFCIPVFFGSRTKVRPEVIKQKYFSLAEKFVSLRAPPVPVF